MAMERKTRKPRTRRKGPDLATLSITELRRELERRAAISNGAPLPEEIAKRSAIEVDRMRRSCGVMVIVESLDQAGVCGDYLRYTAVLLSSGPLEKREMQDLCRRLERPLPSGDSEPEEKVPLRRFRKGA